MSIHAISDVLGCEPSLYSLVDTLQDMEFRSNSSSPLWDLASPTPPRVRTPHWMQKNVPQEELTPIGEPTTSHDVDWCWKASEKSNNFNHLTYFINLPKKVTKVTRHCFARGMSKTCHDCTYDGKACVILIEPLNVPTLNEDVNKTLFPKLAKRFKNPFVDATPTSYANYSADKRIYEEILTSNAGLLPQNHFFGVCSGDVDQHSLIENYPEAVLKEVSKNLGDDFEENLHGRAALTPTLFGVQIWEKYEMSLEEYVKQSRDITAGEVANVLSQIGALKHQLYSRGLTHDDLHAGNIVINTKPGLTVKFIDLGLRKDSGLFKGLYKEFISGSSVGEKVTLEDIMEVVLASQPPPVAKALEYDGPTSSGPEDSSPSTPTRVAKGGGAFS